MSGDPKRPASEKQIAALTKFGCKVPAGLTVEDASPWLDMLIGKSKRHETISDVERSGPPSFHRASETRPPPPTSSPAPPAARPTAEPPNDNSNAEVLPTSEGWVTVEAVREEELAGGVKTKLTSRFSDHASPGETYSAAASRLMLLAQKAVGN